MLTFRSQAVLCDATRVLLMGTQERMCCCLRILWHVLVVLVSLCLFFSCLSSPALLRGRHPAITALMRWRLDY